MGQKELIYQHASNFQAFIGMKHIERELQNSEGTLQQLLEKGEIDKIDIKIGDHILVEDTILRMKSLIDVEVTREKETTQIEKNKPNRAQMMVETKFSKQLILKKQFTLDEGFFIGCCLLPSGLIVFADYDNARVKIFQSNCFPSSQIIFHGRGIVCDVEVINENQVTVFNTESQTISIIDIDSIGMKVLKTLKIKSCVSGITHYDGSIFFCVPDKGIMKIKIKTGKIKKRLFVNSHIDTDGERICYTCPDVNTVTILDFDFHVIFLYNENTILEGPIGLSMDLHQNVYLYQEMEINVKFFSVNMMG